MKNTTVSNFHPLSPINPNMLDVALTSSLLFFRNSLANGSSDSFAGFLDQSSDKKPSSDAKYNKDDLLIKSSSLSRKSQCRGQGTKYDERYRVKRPVEFENRRQVLPPVALQELQERNKKGSNNPVRGAALTPNSIKVFYEGQISDEHYVVNGFANEVFDNLDLEEIDISGLSFFGCSFINASLPKVISSSIFGAATVGDYRGKFRTEQSTLIGSDWSDGLYPNIYFGGHNDLYSSEIDFISNHHYFNITPVDSKTASLIKDDVTYFYNLGRVNASLANFSGAIFSQLDCSSLDASDADVNGMAISKDSYIRDSILDLSKVVMYDNLLDGKYRVVSDGFVELDFLAIDAKFRDAASSIILYDRWMPKAMFDIFTRKDPVVFQINLLNSTNGSIISDINPAQLTPEEIEKTKKPLLKYCGEKAARTYGAICVDESYTDKVDCKIDVVIDADDVEYESAFVTSLGYGNFLDPSFMYFTKPAIWGPVSFVFISHELDHLMDGAIHSMGYSAAKNNPYGVGPAETVMSYKNNPFLGKVYEEQGEEADLLIARSNGLLCQMLAHVMAKSLNLKNITTFVSIEEGASHVHNNDYGTSLVHYEPDSSKDVVIDAIDHKNYRVRFTDSGRTLVQCLESLEFAKCPDTKLLYGMTSMVILERSSNKVKLTTLYAGGRNIIYRHDGIDHNIRLFNDSLIEINPDSELEYYPYPAIARANETVTSHVSSSSHSLSPDSSQSSSSSSKSSSSSSSSQSSSSSSSASSASSSSSSSYSSSSGSDSKSVSNSVSGQVLPAPTSNSGSLSSSNMDLVGSSFSSSSSSSSSLAPADKSNPGQGDNDILLKALLPSLIIPAVLVILCVALKKNNMLPRSWVKNPKPKKDFEMLARHPGAEASV